MAKKAVKINVHDLIPKHEKLSESEKQKVLEEYNVEVKDLPSILITDPALFEIDVKPGDVIKIERNSPVAGKIIFYRGVVE
ncbi:DNA-directed RNA polymerase subunit H [Candidatus Woesearchaeota archaeon]|nr:DNA-directed RNA polymerase subunit H [Candidatus Woesearchaeota archaeon]